MEKYNLKIINLFEKIYLLPALPNAMDKGVLESFKLYPPEIPLIHGCSFMTRDPVIACYACEFRNDPKNYIENVKHKERLMILHEYFNRSYKAICVLKECHASLVAEVLEYLNTPRDKRPYTDSQIMDPHFEEGGELVVLLRKLGAIYKNGLLKV